MSRVGELTTEELVNSLNKIMGKGYSKKEIRIAVQEFILVSDKNNNGTLDVNEFISYLAKIFNECDPDHKLREAFAVFDEDNNNEISHEELKRTLNKLGAQYTDLEIERIISKVDKNGDGVIDFEEFKEMMTGSFN